MGKKVKVSSANKSWVMTKDEWDLMLHCANKTDTAKYIETRPYKLALGPELPLTVPSDVVRGISSGVQNMLDVRGYFYGKREIKKFQDYADHLGGDVTIEAAT